MNRELFENDFQDVYVREQDGRRIFCFRAGMTTYEEALADGRYMAVGWNAAGYPQNVLEAMPTNLDERLFAQPQAFDLEANGCCLAFDWTEKDFACAREEKGLHAVLTLESGIAPLRVKVHTLLDGTAVLRRWLEVENTGDTPLNLNRIAPMCGPIEVIRDVSEYGVSPEEVYTLGYMSESEWGSEGLYTVRPLTRGGFCVGGKLGAGRHRHPMFTLENRLLGTMMQVQLGYSGAYEFRFDYEYSPLAGGNRTQLAFRAEITGYAPLLRLAPGEAFETPAIHVCVLAGDLDDSVNMMHRHLRRSEFPAEPDGHYELVECGMGPERVMDIPATKHFADTAASVGAETLIIDAGWSVRAGDECAQWWARCGDWTVDAGKYPRGIGEIRDYIHEKGLLFGLWLDAERIGPDSEAGRAHPDWLATRMRDGKKSTMIDMTNPEALAWVEAQIARLVEEYGIDLFRLDYNLGESDLLLRTAHAGGTECSQLRYDRAVCDMYARLRARYPQVVFENCAGGGGRTDVGFVRQFTHTWVSDWNRAPRSLAVANGMTMALPPEKVDRLVSGMDCHTRADLDFQLRVTLFGRPTTNDYNPIGSAANPGQLARVRHAFELYKGFIRPLGRDALIFHHTPVLGGVQPGGICVLERAAYDRTRAVIGAFRLSGGAPDEAVVQPRGLSSALSYRVTLDNSGDQFEVSGRELTQSGLRIRLTHALTSELVLLEAR